MTDLANIQEKLNSDDAFRQRFVADPIGVLKKGGPGSHNGNGGVA